MARRYTRRHHPIKILFRRIVFFVLVVLIASLAGVVYYNNTSNDRTAIKASSDLLNVTPDKYKPKLTMPIVWPPYGQSAYGTMQHGVLAKSNNQEKAVPIASLAKTITALAILEKKPLEPGELGPKITITQKDVNLFNEYLSKNGSVAKVTVGQKLSQYHAMQAMLMQSANNITDSLVIWAFGSMDQYTEYANEMVKRMKLPQTHVADASGFSPKTISTAEEMTQVATAYMKTPILREISTQIDVVIPSTGPIINYNVRFNTDDMIGIKAGNTDEAKRCFMSASVKNGEIYSVSVVLGAKTLNQAIKDSQTILKNGNLSVEAEG